LAQDALHVLDKAEVEHLVGLVEHHVAGRGQHQRAARHQVHHPPHRRHHNLGAGAKLRLLGANRRAAEHRHDLDRQVLGVGAQRLGDLDAELAGRRQHDRLHVVARGIEVLEQRQTKRRRLTGPGLGLPDHVVPCEQLGNRLLLDRSRLGVAQLVKGRLDFGLQAQFVKGCHSGGSA